MFVARRFDFALERLTFRHLASVFALHYGPCVAGSALCETTLSFNMNMLSTGAFGY
jgi:hypothetical protein